ncbi:unnamed protein product, partial [Mesorhabditis belari]|uniref:Uncharacterized protein n=1 Tax=Mesorhabditis belari TaxID=2138241 RepID=A0AAF3EVS9_9BILA
MDHFTEIFERKFLFLLVPFEIVSISSKNEETEEVGSSITRKCLYLCQGRWLRIKFMCVSSLKTGSRSTIRLDYIKFQRKQQLKRKDLERKPSEWKTMMHPAKIFARFPGNVKSGELSTDTDEVMLNPFLETSTRTAVVDRTLEGKGSLPSNGKLFRSNGEPFWIAEQREKEAPTLHDFPMSPEATPITLLEDIKAMVTFA